MTLNLPTPAQPLKLGTRGSPLALAQAHETRDRLAAVFDLPEKAFDIVVIKTTGDNRAMIAADREWNDGAARAKLLQIFEAVGLEDEWVVATRRKLSRILFG